MALRFSLRTLPGRVKAPVATLADSQGSESACALIALHSGAAWARKPELTESSLRACLQAGLLASRAVYGSGKQLPEASKAAQHVPGVECLEGAEAPPLLAHLSAADGPSAAESPVDVLQRRLERLGSRSGFLTLTHQSHTVVLLPERDSSGELRASAPVSPHTLR